MPQQAMDSFGEVALVNRNSKPPQNW